MTKMKYQGPSWVKKAAAKEILDLEEDEFTERVKSGEIPSLRSGKYAAFTWGEGRASTDRMIYFVGKRKS